jgi:hypothetical protein
MPPPTQPLKLTATACYDSPMPRDTDAFLAELGLERADPTGFDLGDDPLSQIERAGLNHAVMGRFQMPPQWRCPFW